MKVLPGDLVQVSGQAILGEGLYQRGSIIHASRRGDITLTDSVVSVQSLDQKGCAYATIPVAGDLILGTVNRITARYASIDIAVIERPAGSLYLQEPFKGTIRLQDIHSAPLNVPTSSQQLYLWFRPGDLVRARVLSVGDSSSGFFLSTIEAEEDSVPLGVVFAKCATSGEPMVPLAWNQMACPRTGLIENRKTARPTTIKTSDAS